jgi:hypothetical protein
MSITTLYGFLTALAIGPGLPLQKRRPHHASHEHDRRHAFEPTLYEGEVEGGGTIVVAHDCGAGLLARAELACDDSRSWATSPIARSSSRS